MHVDSTQLSRDIVVGWPPYFFKDNILQIGLLLRDRVALMTV
jgi:hypothetical protein